jgi:ATP-binding cassette subfamily B protein
MPEPMRQGLRFEAVRFAYPGDERRALDGVELSIDPGHTIAFVGPNGSGKSTAVKLLCRLYDPDAGRVTLDGRSMSAYRVRDVRRLFAVLTQDFVRYQLPAAENIGLGDPPMEKRDEEEGSETDREERIRAAAVRSGADQVVATLRHGYATVLGRTFENGEELSAGEWQKIALARVFMSPARVLVFDEPASWLDANAEREFFDSVRELAGERTVILISHRFANVRMCDRIFVFDQGRIEDQGTHEELVARGGLYARMYHLQAGSYR